MSVESPGPDHWQVTPPSWRFDINIEADLIEELARLGGYDAIAEPLTAKLSCHPIMPPHEVLHL